MSMPEWFRSCALLCLAVALELPASAQCVGDTLTPLDIAASRQSVSVTGATAGSRILVIGYGHSWDAERYSTRFHRYRAFLTADDAGALHLDRGPFAADTLWTAVDVASGRCGSTAPRVDAGKHRHKALPNEALRLNNGQLRKIVAEFPLAYLIVVRPGEGVWELSAGDGSAHDDDRTLDGKVTLPFEQVVPLGTTTAALGKVAKDDVVLLFIPHQGSVAFGRVEE